VEHEAGAHQTPHLSDLDKIDVRVGTILAVEDVAHSEKLVRLRVDFGDHARSILVGMKNSGPIQRCRSASGLPPFRRPTLTRLWID
jgi:tRNA-binding EMAP/Myf-like protein